MQKYRSTTKFLKICPVCEQRFTTGKFEKIYCSPKCELESKEKESLYAQEKYLQKYSSKSKKKIMKVCPICENQFETTYSCKKYCSKECKNIANNQMRLDAYKKKKKSKKKKEQKICKGCNKTFSTSRPYQKFCSRECRRKFANSIFGKPLIFWEIFNRDNFTCQYCGRNPTQHGVRLTIDHIKSQMDGGKTELDNLVTACIECNILKGSRPLRHEANFKRRIEQQQNYSSRQKVFKFFFKPEK